MARVNRSIQLALILGIAVMFSPAVRAQSILNYHATPDRSGTYVVPGLTWERAARLHLDRKFDGRVSGHVYAQPLFWDSPRTKQKLLIVATEDDVVYALDANSGKAVWEKTLGRPVQRSALPCGNIDPLGITGTPVIDGGKGAVYLDAMVDAEDGTGPQHLVFGLAIENGATLPGFPVEVAEAVNRLGKTFMPSVQNQRGALAIADDTLFIPYGGHFGDCGPYHGWAVGIKLNDPRTASAWSTRAEGGGVWAPGGIVYDGRSLYVATGNTKEAKEWADGEAVIRLGSDLRAPTNQRDFFAPTDWKALDGRDADLGGTNPVLIDIRDSKGTDHLLLALGKDGKAYLLDRDNLGGIGGALAVENVARSQIITAPVVYSVGRDTFVAFEGSGRACSQGTAKTGLTVLKIEARPSPKISTAWCGASQGRGAPIVTTVEDGSSPIVWAAGAEGDNRLHGFRGDTGQPVYTGGTGEDTMPGLRHFATIVAANGRLLLAGDGRVYAFSP
jgi:outer membrane protein assembly factor BamB